MTLPRSVNELQRFRGMVNHLRKFIRDILEHTTPLCNFLKKNGFKLQKPQLDATENLKTLVTLAPRLKIFDSKLPTRLKTDALFTNKIIEPWITRSDILLCILRELCSTTNNVTHRSKRKPSQ